MIKDPNKLMFWGLVTIIGLVFLYVVIVGAIEGRRHLINYAYDGGYTAGVESVRKDAVKVGVGRWEVGTDSNGVPGIIFVWNTLPKNPLNPEEEIEEVVADIEEPGNEKE